MDQPKVALEMIEGFIKTKTVGYEEYKGPFLGDEEFDDE